MGLIYDQTLKINILMPDIRYSYIYVCIFSDKTFFLWWSMNFYFIDRLYKIINRVLQKNIFHSIVIDCKKFFNQYFGENLIRLKSLLFLQIWFWIVPIFQRNWELFLAVVKKFIVDNIMYVRYTFSLYSSYFRCHDICTYYMKVSWTIRSINVFD